MSVMTAACTTFLTHEVRSSVTSRDTDMVLRERLPFLTASVTRGHNGGIVWRLTSAAIHFRPEETKRCAGPGSRSPHTQNKPCLGGFSSAVLKSEPLLCLYGCSPCVRPCGCFLFVLVFCFTRSHVTISNGDKSSGTYIHHRVVTHTVELLVQVVMWFQQFSTRPAVRDMVGAGLFT